MLSVVPPTLTQSRHFQRPTLARPKGPHAELATCEGPSVKMKSNGGTKFVHDPYAAIHEFWGEDLSRELVDRMIRSPEAHYDAFADEYLTRGSGLGPLPSLEVAHLRPILTTSAAD
jgi:hypothetical protein